MGKRQQRARELRSRIGTAPDRVVTLPREELVLMLGEDGADGDAEEQRESARLAQAMLVQHGIAAEPDLVDASAGTRARLRLTRAYAVQGAVVVAVLATVAAGVALWIYGLLVAGATAIGVAVVALRFDWLNRVVPASVPRGRILGGIVTGLLAILVGLTTILPIRAARVDDGRTSAATGLLGSVYRSIESGDVSGAQQLFERARAVDPDAVGIEDARARLTVAHVQELLDEQARREGVFDEAERAFRRGDVNRAIALMSTIRGFRNAAERIVAYRAALRRERSRSHR